MLRRSGLAVAPISRSRPALAHGSRVGIPSAMGGLDVDACPRWHPTMDTGFHR